MCDTTTTIATGDSHHTAEKHTAAATTPTARPSMPCTPPQQVIAPLSFVHDDDDEHVTVGYTLFTPADGASLVRPIRRRRYEYYRYNAPYEDATHSPVALPRSPVFGTHTLLYRKPRSALRPIRTAAANESLSGLRERARFMQSHDRARTVQMDELERRVKEQRQRESGDK